MFELLLELFLAGMWEAAEDYTKQLQWITELQFTKGISFTFTSYCCQLHGTMYITCMHRLII